MKNTTKRIWSIVLCVLMSISLLTGIVLPAAAETTEPAAPADPYAKVTVVEGTNKPSSNVFFFDAAWSTAPATEGEEFTYTYGGNGKTYTLTWGTNAFASMTDLKTAMEAYSVAWAADTTMSQDFVAVFAVGEYGALEAATLTSTAGEEVPTTAQLLNVYLLGANAGKNPVNDSREDKVTAKIVQNGRSIDKTKESVLVDTINLPAKSNIVIDGFAGTEAATFSNNLADQYVNATLLNYYLKDMTTPLGGVAFEFTNLKSYLMWEAKNCYFDYSKIVSADSPGINNYQDIYGNKMIFDNCVFVDGATRSGAVDHHLCPDFMSKTDAATGVAFLGSYATKPEVAIKNCVITDWKSSTFFRPNMSNTINTYDAASALIKIENNKFYNSIGAKGNHQALIGLATYNNVGAAINLTITGNYFSTDEDCTRAFVKGQQPAFIGTNGNATTDSNVSITIKNNIFKFDHLKYCAFNGASVASNTSVDLSANLYMDLDGNVLPTYAYNPRAYGFAAQSDVYVSAALNGGVREMLSVKDVKGGALLYNHILINISTAFTGFQNYFNGVTTILLERGKTYNTDEMFVFGDANTEFEGVYSDLACTTEVDTLTQDSFNGGTKYYLKASYSETANNVSTKATVIYAITSPTKYEIITPAGSSYDAAMRYTFNGITYTDGTTASDGVAATFSNDLIDSTIEKCKPYIETVIDHNIYYVANEHKGMETIVLLTPGSHTTTDADEFFTMDYSHAVIGPNFTKSPYGAENAEGGFANGRSIDPATEALVPVSFRNINGRNACYYAYQGVVFTYTGQYNPIYMGTLTSTTITRDADYNAVGVKNCISTSPRPLVGFLTGKQGLLLDLYLQDNVYYGVGLSTVPQHVMSSVRANKKVANNIAVITDKCVKHNTTIENYYDNDDDVVNVWKNQANVFASGIKFYDNGHSGEFEDVKGSDATCVEAGFVEKRCTVCGATKTETLEIDKNNHTGNNTEGVGAKEATCTEPGYTGDTVCECGTVIIEGTEIAKKAHTEEIIPGKEATCKETGLTEGKKCSVCGEILEAQTETPKAAHTEETIPGKEATCTETGLTEGKKCSVCDEILVEQEEIKKAAHTESELIVVIAPTYTTEGVGKIECTVCHTTLKDNLAIPMLTPAGEASINGKTYESLEAALADAADGDTVKLMANAEVDYIALNPGVKLDLNGKTLKADYVVGFNTSEIFGGQLDVDQDKVALDQKNGGYLPVYNNGVYKFITVTMKEGSDAEGSYYFSPDLSQAHDELFAGAAASGVKVVVRLSWTKAGNYTATQDFVYMDAMVKTVIESYGKEPEYPNHYTAMFTAIFSDTEADTANDLKISAVLVSDTGVEIASTGMDFSTNN